MDRDPRPAGAIDQYVAELELALRLRPLLRRRLSAEVREHLEDSVRAERLGGATREDAERHAVAAFGGARALAEAYRSPRPSRTLVGSSLAAAAVAAVATALVVPQLDAPRAVVRTAVTTVPDVPDAAAAPASPAAATVAPPEPPAIAGSGFALLAAYTEDDVAPRWQEPPATACATTGAEAPVAWTLRTRRAAAGTTWELTGTVATTGAVRVLLADGGERQATRAGSRFASADGGAPPVALLLTVAGRDCRVELPPLPDAGLA